MAADETTDFFPLLDDDVTPQFDVAMRGYDRRQVDNYVARIGWEMAELQTARDNALAISADRAAQLANREAHIESLRRQSTTDVEHIDPAQVSDRIRDMLRLAVEEAAQTRKTAEEQAERTIAAARSEADRVRADAAEEQQRLTQAATQRSAEADQKLAQARVSAAGELETARAKVKQMLDEASAERDRLDTEAKAMRDSLDAEAKLIREDEARIAQEQRVTADEDFEITLRERRRAGEARIAEIHAEHAAARKTLLELQERIAAALKHLPS